MSDLRLNPLLVILTDEELERFGNEYRLLRENNLTIQSFEQYCIDKAFRERQVRMDRIGIGALAFERKLEKNVMPSSGRKSEHAVLPFRRDRVCSPKSISPGLPCEYPGAHILARSQP